MRWYEELLANKVLIAAFVSFGIAQLLKFIIYSIVDKKLDFSKLIATGSMPSSHSALVMSLCVSYGISSGLSTPEFAISSVLALIVMHDASNVRRSVGKQAQLWNKMIKERDFAAEKIKEILGHTPLEVFAGAFLGAGISILICI